MEWQSIHVTSIPHCKTAYENTAFFLFFWWSWWQLNLTKNKCSSPRNIMWEVWSWLNKSKDGFRIDFQSLNFYVQTFGVKDENPFRYQMLQIIWESFWSFNVLEVKSPTKAICLVGVVFLWLHLQTVALRKIWPTDRPGISKINTV